MCCSVHFCTKKNKTSDWNEVVSCFTHWLVSWKYKSLLFFFSGILHFQVFAQNIQQIIPLGGKGTVNPVVVETISPDLLVVAGTFSGELAVGGEIIVSEGADDVFVLVLKNGEVFWLKKIGNRFNDRVTPGVIVDGNNIILGLTFWERLNIDGTEIFNPNGGQTFALIYLELDTGDLVQVYPVHSSGAVNYAQMRDLGEEILIGFWGDGSLYLEGGTEIAGKDEGLVFLTFSSASDFSLMLFVRTSGQSYFTGMEMLGEDLIASGYFLGTMELDQQQIATQTIYYDGFALKFGSVSKESILKRFGGIFDNFFTSALKFNNVYYIGGHFSGVLEMGGMSIETINTLGDIVLLELDSGLNVIGYSRSEEEEDVFLYTMYYDEEGIGLSCQFYDRIRLESEELICSSATSINAGVFNWKHNDFSSKVRFCLSGNTLNLQQKRSGDYYITVFVTDQNFERYGESFLIEGLNDGFVVLEKTTSTKELSSTSPDVLFFPNPASDEVKWSVDPDVEYIEIFDLSGNLQLRTRESRIGLTELTSGVYIVHFYTKSGEIRKGRFVKI